LTGASPVFVDIDPVTFCMDPRAAAAAVGPATKAIMPVHLYGHPADMTALTELADSEGLLLIEDAAQAHGASWQGRAVGSFGTCAAFSFYPTKNMTSGEGGMVTTGDPGLARTVRLLRNQGMEARYQNEIVGLNNRMTDIHAAIGLVQLDKLAGWTQARRSNAAFLSQNLEGVIVPTEEPGAVHVYHQYTIRVPGDRDQFAARLAERGVGSGVYYPIPVHRLPSFGLDLDLPVTDQVAADCLSLPVHPSLSEQDLEQIVGAVNEVAKEAS
jgi:dTDP-4-amino-4,6-dideoxygalactose transaminase